MVHRFIVLLTLILLVVLAWDSVYAENPVVIFDKVLSLDGDGDYIEIPEGVWFDGDLTIEAWVFIRKYTNWSMVMEFGNGVDQDNVAFSYSREESGLPSFVVRPSTKEIASDVPLELNSWAHLACTLNRNSGTIYINGVEVGSGNIATPPKNVIRKNNFIGRSSWHNLGVPDANVMYDEIRIWNIAKSTAEIQSTMNTSLSGDEEGLVGYWNFDDGTAKDLTPNGNDGEMKGDAQIVNLTDLPLSIVAEDNIANPNKEFTLDISIQHFYQPGKISLDLVFDPSILKSKFINKGNKIISWINPQIDNQKGTISLTDISFNVDIKNNTKLATVNFIALKKGKSKLEIKDAKLTFNDGSNRLIETSHGTVNILPKGSFPLFAFLERENLFTELFWHVATCSIAALFAFLYFSIYLFDPTKQEHLYFSIIMLVICVVYMSILILGASDTYDNNGILVGLSENPTIAALAMTRFFYSMQYKKLPVRFFPHALYVSYLYLAFFSNFYFDLNLYLLPDSISVPIYAFLWIFDFYWMFKYPTKPKAAGLNILIIGMCIFSLLVIYMLLTRILFLIPDFIPFLPPDGMSHMMIIFILTMAIFLAKNIQSTNLSLKQLTQNLETRIEERTFELTQTNEKLLKSEKEARDELADAHDM